jgi:hypothetical protein
MLFKTRLTRGLTLTASAAWLAFVLPGAAPARADGNWWDSMLGAIGIGPNKPADDAIDYSARPALVVPPKMDLPPPQPTMARPADWPNDPDAAARRRAEADSRRPAPPAPPAAPGDASTDADDSGDNQQTDPKASLPDAPRGQKPTVAQSWIGSQSAGLGGGGTSVFSGGGGPLTMPDWDISKWNPFDSNKTDDARAVRTLKVGVEPPREYLTQPPPGYEAPVAVDTDSDTASGSVQHAQNAKAPPPDAGPAPGDQIGKSASSR